MIAILSPAKNMKTGAAADTVPAFLQQAHYLGSICKDMTPAALESCLRLSPELALKSYMMWQDWQADKAVGSAATVYNGIAFTYLGADDFSPQDMQYAADHLYILSALYGVLRASDGICPYRLEMMCRAFPGGNLYRYWGNTVYNTVVRPGETVINLASREYSRMITDHAAPQDHIIDVHFLTHKKGKLTEQATYAKMARGSMARFISKNRLDAPEKLKAFSQFGYEYSKKLSTPRKYVFVREVQ